MQQEAREKLASHGRNSRKRMFLTHFAKPTRNNGGTLLIPHFTLVIFKRIDGDEAILVQNAREEIFLILLGMNGPGFVDCNI